MRQHCTLNAPPMSVLSRQRITYTNLFDRVSTPVSKTLQDWISANRSLLSSFGSALPHVSSDLQTDVLKQMNTLRRSLLQESDVLLTNAIGQTVLVTEDGSRQGTTDQFSSYSEESATANPFVKVRIVLYDNPRFARVALVEHSASQLGWRSMSAIQSLLQSAAPTTFNGGIVFATVTLTGSASDASTIANLVNRGFQCFVCHLEGELALQVYQNCIVSLQGQAVLINAFSGLSTLTGDYLINNCASDAHLTKAIQTKVENVQIAHVFDSSSADQSELNTQLSQFYAQNEVYTYTPLNPTDPNFDSSLEEFVSGSNAKTLLVSSFNILPTLLQLLAPLPSSWFSTLEIVILPTAAQKVPSSDFWQQVRVRILYPSISQKELTVTPSSLNQVGQEFFFRLLSSVRLSVDLCSALLLLSPTFSVSQLPVLNILKLREQDDTVVSLSLSRQIQSLLSVSDTLTTPATVAVVMTGSKGYLNNKPIEYQIALQALRSRLVPLNPQNVKFVTISNPNTQLESTCQSLYAQGTRIFVGCTTTTELLILRSFLTTHPDAVWLSTSATSSQVFQQYTTGNLFRFVTQDDQAVSLFYTACYNYFHGRRLLVLHDIQSEWSNQLGLGFANLIVSDNANVFTLQYDGAQGIPVLGELLYETDVVMVLSENTTQVLTWYKQQDFTNELVLGDVAAYASLSDDDWSALHVQKRGLFAVTSWLASYCYSFAQQVYGKESPVSPHVVNLLQALWFASDAFLSKAGKLYKDQINSTYGPSLSNFFDNSGAANYYEVALVKGDLGKWTVETTAFVPAFSKTQPQYIDIVGHFGFPETLLANSLESFNYALTTGANMIHVPVAPSKDGVLFCCQSPNLSIGTNVQDLPQFASRASTKIVNGVSQTGFFIEDFTAAEIQTLFVREPLPADRPDKVVQNDTYRIPTLLQVMQMVQSYTENGYCLLIQMVCPTYFGYEAKFINQTYTHINVPQLLFDVFTSTDFVTSNPLQSYVLCEEIAPLIQFKNLFLSDAAMPTLGLSMTGAGAYDLQFNFDSNKVPLGANTDIYDLLNYKDLSAANAAQWNADFLEALCKSLASLLVIHKYLIRPVRTLSPPINGFDRRETGETTKLPANAKSAGFKVYVSGLATEAAFRQLKLSGEEEQYTDEVLKYNKLNLDGFVSDNPSLTRFALLPNNNRAVTNPNPIDTVPRVINEKVVVDKKSGYTGSRSKMEP